MPARYLVGVRGNLLHVELEVKGVVIGVGPCGATVLLSVVLAVAHRRNHVAGILALEKIGAVPVIIPIALCLIIPRSFTTNSWVQSTIGSNTTAHIGLEAVLDEIA